jgi:hypothetical protein
LPEQNKSSAHYVHLLLAQAETLGFSAKAFLATANVSPDDVSALDKWVDNSVLTRIVKALWRLSNDEGMGFYERPVALGTGQVTFDYMLGGQNLAAIFERGQRLLSVLPPEEYPISQFYLDARVQRIYGGANEIMKEVISRSL